MGHDKTSRDPATKATLGICALALWLLALAPAASATPNHPFLESASLSGFNHACGVAVDTEGDLYVASAGESKIKIFNPAHTEIGSISNANEPCGLAVDTNGNLYVSEKATGEVLKYHPTAYPFVGAPNYEAPVTIDASTKAQGIATDPSDNRLYVAEGAHIASYSSSGVLGEDEVQRVRVEIGSGSFELCFEGQCTAPIPWNATAKEVEEALEGLSTIGAGNVSVVYHEEAPRGFFITFTGKLGSKDVPTLEAKPLSAAAVIPETQGWNGRLGEGTLTEATGVGAYTYAGVGKERYVFAADSASDKVYVFGNTNINFTTKRELPLRYTIDGTETPAGGFAFSEAGAYLGTDQANGHLLLYDHAHNVVDEFEATGQYFTRIVHTFSDSEPTAIAVDRSGGASDGNLYVSSGASSGAQVLAFGPVEAPLREPRSGLTFSSPRACGTVTDSYGDIYVAGEASIRVYGPTASLLSTISDAAKPCGLAVDSEGNLYASENGRVSLFKPSAYPPTGTTTYGAPTEIVGSYEGHRPIAVDPADDHFLVSREPVIEEYKSAKEGSALLNGEIGKGLGVTYDNGVDVCAKTGEIYAAGHKGAGAPGTIAVLNPAGTEMLALIDGSSSPKGEFPRFSETGGSIAVDQSNCHVLLNDIVQREVIEEYEPSGAFVAQSGGFPGPTAEQGTDIAIDNGSHSPNQGNAYVAYKDSLYAFGPLEYETLPTAVTGLATEVGEGGATLTGTVNPNEFEVEECFFEWGETTSYGNKALCEEPDAEEIGTGKEPVPVHARISGLDLSKRYYFRLLASNKFGASEGEPAHFGPPVLAEEPARPILYTEATVNASIDPSGLKTVYRVRYGTSAEYGETVEPAGSPIAASAAPSQVHVRLSGLAEGSEYHYCIAVENEARQLPCEDRTFVTQERPAAESCPNEALRTGFSAHLPDCRAYELVTPADTGGLLLTVPGSHGASVFNEWMVTPSGARAGGSLVYGVEGTLPGFEGNGHNDTLEALRGEGGWSSRLLSATYAQFGYVSDNHGISPDHGYSFWEPSGSAEAEYGAGQYLRTPDGTPASPNCKPRPGHFEWVGCGSLGFEPQVNPGFISPGGAQVIFSSRDCGDCPPPVPLEPNAPPEGTAAVYDRSPGGPTHVVSLPPAGASKAVEEEFETESAEYLGSSADGSAVAFKVGGALYVRRDGAETIEVAEPPSVFAGLSGNGARIFYAKAGFSGNAKPNLYACDLDAGPCAGPEAAQEPTEIAPESIFVNVSADGSQVYFTSEEALTGSEENEGHEQAEAEKPNLYVWDGAATRFIAVLDPGDLARFASSETSLTRWINGVNPSTNNLSGLGSDASRTTPDGKALVFQSHARLTSYDNTEATAAACGDPEKAGERCGEVYRYDTADGSLVCVSCDPSGAPATGEADLQGGGLINPVRANTYILIPNVTEDGRTVVFETPDALTPEDANAAADVYEWRAPGAHGCKRPGGCLALISSGQGENDSYLYSMTPDGHDVFFKTLERLVGSDAVGSSSLYDAREEGGFPEAEGGGICEGDACQPQGSEAPSLPGIQSHPSGRSGNLEAPRPRCPKGKHAAHRHGRAVCVKKHRGRGHHPRKGSHRRGRTAP